MNPVFRSPRNNPTAAFKIQDEANIRSWIRIKCRPL